MQDKKSNVQNNVPGSNPNVQSHDGGINPSAPSTGTEGWGATPDERRAQVGQNDPAASNPNTTAPGDIRRTSYPQNESAQNPAAGGVAHEPEMETREQALQRNPNNRAGKTFSCADVGRENCTWSVTGHNDDEILGYVRKHAREAHGQSDFSTDELNNVRHAIRDRAA